MNILVMGGTQFFGARLVRMLIDAGHSVTIATRGQSKDAFGDAVKRVQIDRRDHESMQKAFGGLEFDLVYDQICYNPKEAKIAVDVLGNRVKRYVFTSSQAVYDHLDSNAILVESDFDASTYPYDLDLDTYSYAEGKRQAEAYFAQHAPFPVVSARVGLVISGTDDYTGRLAFHVARILRGNSIGVLPDADKYAITYVTAWDIASFLLFAGVDTTYSGGINAGNRLAFYTVQELCEEIAVLLGKNAKFHTAVDRASDPDFSPYSLPVSFRMSVELADSLGFVFPDIKDFLPQIVEQIKQPQEA